MSIRKRLLSTTYVSEPNPYMFGNEANPRPVPATWSSVTNNWLRSRFHFAFAEWGNGPTSFGVLRVLNDDLVQPKRMFGPHPHRDMEIATYIVNGKLTHWHTDSNGGGAAQTLGRGSLQFMTAGTGVTHSEGNDGDEPLRFVQMWIVPRKRGLKPNYGAYDASLAGSIVRNAWIHLACDADSPVPEAKISLNQDCNIYVAELAADCVGLSLPLQSGRQLYVVALEGNLDVSGLSSSGESTPTVSLEAPESCTADGPMTFTCKPASSTGAHVLVVEVAKP